MHVFAKNREDLSKLGPWREKKPGVTSILEHYEKLKCRHGNNRTAIERELRGFYKSLEPTDPSRTLAHFWRSDARGLFFGADISSASTSIPDYEVIHPITRKPCKKPTRGWGCNPGEMKRRIADDRVLFGHDETTIPLKKSYLEEVDSIVRTPVLYKDGRAASLMLKDMLGPGVFDNPKDHYVLSELIDYARVADGIVLDFFAGSGSTAHAVLHRNIMHGYSSRYILVQFPERLDAEKRVQKAASEFCDALGVDQNLAEITKERLRCAGDMLRQEHRMFTGDLGFRVFKLDTSSMCAWDPNRGGLEQAILEGVDHIKSGSDRGRCTLRVDVEAWFGSLCAGCDSYHRGKMYMRDRRRKSNCLP